MQVLDGSFAAWIPPLGPELRLPPSPAASNLELQRLLLGRDPDPRIEPFSVQGDFEMRFALANDSTWLRLGWCGLDPEDEEVLGGPFVGLRVRF